MGCYDEFEKVKLTGTRVCHTPYYVPCYEITQLRHTSETCPNHGIHESVFIWNIIQQHTMLMTQQACSTTTMNKSQPYSDSASTAAETMTSEQATEYARFSRESNALNTWTDTFFDDDDDIVAVFDFDYDSMISYYTKLTWLIFTLITISGPVFASIIFIRRYWPLWILYYLVLYFLRANVIWNVRAQHLAITRDGIRFVRNRRPFLCGLPCSDLGKTSKTGE